jgi:hypothetical protein
MRAITLRLPQDCEREFWTSYRRPLAWVDALSTVFVAAYVLLVELNTLGLLPDRQPRCTALRVHSMIIVSIKLLHLALVTYSPVAWYTKHRTWVCLFIRTYVWAHYMLAATKFTSEGYACSAGSLVSGDAASTASVATAYRLLFLSTGTMSTMFYSILHPMPYRYLLPFHLSTTILQIYAGSSRIISALQHAPGLRAEAQWMCDTINEGISVFTGMGNLDMPSGPGCQPHLAVGRTVLMVQLLCALYIPLWLAYVAESKAKQIFMAARHRHAHDANGVEWAGITIYAAMLVGGVVVMDIALDVLYWLDTARHYYHGGV